MCIRDRSSKKLGKTAEYVRNKQVPLEVCITSNIHTNMYEEYSKHPVTDLINLEFNVSINTDNRLMSNTSMNKEIDIAINLGINNVENILEKSARYSLLYNI